MKSLDFDTKVNRVGYEDGRFYANGLVTKARGLGRMDGATWHAYLGGSDQWGEWRGICSNLGMEPPKRVVRIALWDGKPKPVMIMRTDETPRKTHISISFANDPSLATLFATAYAQDQTLWFQFSNSLIAFDDVPDDAPGTLMSQFENGDDAIFAHDLPTIVVMPKEQNEAAARFEEPAKKRGFWG